MDIDELIQRLYRVRKFSVEVSSADDVPAAGQGTVEVEHDAPDTIIWREIGCWNQRFNHLEFTNVYRWSSPGEGRLGLEHLRYGNENPVHLVELEKSSSDPGYDLWMSTCPHLCGKDSYTLTLAVNAGDLTLVWHIDGPDKNQISRVCYI